MLDDQKPAAPEALGTEEVSELDSATLRRLMDEVRTSAVEPTAYNRTHNRHNRT